MMINLVPIRNHLEHRLRLTAIEESRQFERKAKRNERTTMAVGVVLGCLAGWLAYLLL